MGIIFFHIFHYFGLFLIDISFFEHNMHKRFKFL
jgi:hypothetical protein